MSDYYATHDNAEYDHGVWRSRPAQAVDNGQGPTAPRGDFVPGRSSVVSLLLRAQNAATPAEAHRLIDQLTDPWTRALARREWDHMHATQTTVIGDEK